MSLESEVVAVPAGVPQQTVEMVVACSETS